MAEIAYQKLKENLQKNNISCVYFLEGDPELVNELEKSLIDKILNKKYTDFDLNIFNSDNFSCDELDVALQTFPMTTNKKCVVMRDICWESLPPEDSEKITKIIQDIPDFCVLIITKVSPVIGIKNTNKLNKIKNLVKKSKEFVYVSAEIKDICIEKQLISWAQEEYNKKLSLENSSIIKNICSDFTVLQIKNELKKICEYEKTPQITEDSIRAICANSPKSNIFEISKNLFSGNISKCFEIMNIIIKQNEDVFGIINILINDYIDILRVKIILENNKETDKILEIFDYARKEFRIKIALQRAKKITNIKLKNSLKHLINADLKLKSSTIDPQTILSELLVLLYTEID